MAGERTPVLRLAGLNLSVEQQQVVGKAATAAIAVNVYRELQAAREAAHISDPGVPTCCSCSSEHISAEAR